MLLDLSIFKWKRFIIDLLLFSLLFYSHSSYGEENEVTVETEKGLEGENGTVSNTDDGVLILTSENLEYVIAAKDFILVHFYAPWPRCGQCKAFEPHYAAAAKELEAVGISLAKVDVTAEDKLPAYKDLNHKRNSVLKLFKKGQYVEDYEGPRTSVGIIDYMKRHEDPEYVTPSYVKILTIANFTEFVNREKISLVLFTSPSVPICGKISDEYEKAAADLLPDNIPLATVDASIEKRLAEQYIKFKDKIPKFVLFRHGERFDYKGPRVRHGIMRYMQAQSHPPSTLTKTPNETKNRISKTEPFILAYFEEQNEFFKKYIRAANLIRDEFTILHTPYAEIAQEYGLPKNTINILFPKIFTSIYEKSLNTFADASASVDEIYKWLIENIVPLVGHRTRTNMASRYSKRPLLNVYYDVDFFDPDLSDTKYLRKKMLPVADKYRDITFAMCSENAFESELKSLGLTDSGEDTNAAIFDEKGFKYQMEPTKPFTADKLEKFVQQFKRGELKPHFESQPIPETQDTPLRVVVGNSFENEVLHSKDDVLIDFYAPWCSKCKELDPVFEKVAKHYAKKRPNLVVAKMDSVNNDAHPYFPVPKFPTIYLIKADAKDNPIVYTNENTTFVDIKNFVEKNLPPVSTREEL